MPVYNVEPYLAEALDSVLNQEYQDWELLLVENGSQDKSAEICRGYAEKEKRIRVIQGKKNGPGEGRNLGLESADGTYIMFMDADDFLPSPDVMSRLARIAEATGADITIGNYERLWKGRRLPAQKNTCYAGMTPDSREFRFQGFFSVGSLSYVWGRIYSARFLKEKRIRFADYVYAEDKKFNIDCYLCGAKYAFLEGNCYVYRKNEASISHQYKPDSRECWIKIAEDIKEQLLEKQMWETKKDLVQDLIFFAAFFDAKMEYQAKKRSLRAVRKMLRAYGKETLGKETFHNLAFGKKNNRPSQLLWKIMMRGFSAGMVFHLYFLLAIGIKLLIDLKVDERLSDTGMREAS